MTNKRPVHEIRISNIVAAVWLNDTSHGPRHSVTLCRIYKADADSEWRRSESFGCDDLPLVEKVASLAFTWIHAERQVAR